MKVGGSPFTKMREEAISAVDVTLNRGKVVWKRSGNLMRWSEVVCSASNREILATLKLHERSLAPAQAES